jgi:hypothetical protein
MPETTYDLICEAKASLREKFRNSDNPWNSLKARLKDSTGAPYDEHAEAALDNLAHEVKSKTSCEND